MDLGSQVDTNPADAIFPATGGTRVDPQAFVEVRARLVLSASQLGFPQTASPDIGTKFDHDAAAILFQDLPICPGEASRDEVWSFMSICVLPDLTTWRFPDQNERRFLGGVRNAFQRLWWRASMLRDESSNDPWWLIRLPEDALVGLMERPGISSNSTVARVIAQSIAKLSASLPARLREDAWRAAYKRIRQRVPLANLDSVTADVLVRQLGDLCELTREEAISGDAR